MLVALIVFCLVGLVVGALARLGLAGPDPMSLVQTMLIGIAGSILGGIIGRLIFGPAYRFNILLSVACAMVIVYLVRRSRERRGVRPPGGGMRPPRF